MKLTTEHSNNTTKWWTRCVVCYSLVSNIDTKLTSMGSAHSEYAKLVCPLLAHTAPIPLFNYCWRSLPLKQNSKHVFVFFCLLDVDSFGNSLLFFCGLLFFFLLYLLFHWGEWEFSLTGFFFFRLFYWLQPFDEASAPLESLLSVQS